MANTQMRIKRRLIARTNKGKIATSALMIVAEKNRSPFLNLMCLVKGATLAGPLHLTDNENIIVMTIESTRGLEGTLHLLKGTITIAAGKMTAMIETGVIVIGTVTHLGAIDAEVILEIAIGLVGETAIAITEKPME